MRLSTIELWYSALVDWESLPGGDLVVKGLRDQAAQRETQEALLVAIGAPRLRSLGVEVGEIGRDGHESPEHRLYEILGNESPAAAHSRYNALVRRLVSFERALACAS